MLPLAPRVRSLRLTLTAFRSAQDGQQGQSYAELDHRAGPDNRVRLAVPASLNPHLVTELRRTSSPVLTPWRPSDSRGQSTKLYATPDGSCIAYGAGRTAVIRPIAGEGETRLFGHAQNVTVVKPLSNFFAASGDAAGNVKVRRGGCSRSSGRGSLLARLLLY